jgi:tetratricopeptide (TPR) repeat protein
LLDRLVRVAGILRAFFLALFQLDKTVVLSWPPQNGTADRQLVFVSPHLSVSPIATQAGQSWPPQEIVIRENLEVLNKLMKKIIRVLAIYATLGLMAPFAQVTQLQAQTPTPSPAAAQGQCTDESKAAWYADFTKYRTTEPPKAYDAAKKYLGACPAEEGPIPTYLKKWVVAYDKENRKIRLTNLFVDQRKYAEALALAKEILADEPDNIGALIALGYGGYVLAVTTKNESGNAEAINYAKKAIQAIESGKAPENWAPFKSKDDALGYLYYSVGYLERTSNPTEALTYFIKAAQFDSEIKKNPQTYVFIAAAYENEYAKQSAEYQKNFSGKDETPESKLAVANINQLVDRIIDALARAVAVAGTDAAAQQLKAQWLTRLTELYKFRHDKSEAGLNELIASVMSKPLPPVPTPITTLPATPATTTTPATGSMSNSGSTAAPGSAVPAPDKTTAPAAASTATTTSPKAPVKPKTRNNHRRN